MIWSKTSIGSTQKQLLQMNVVKCESCGRKTFPKLMPATKAQKLNNIMKILMLQHALIVAIGLEEDEEDPSVADLTDKELVQDFQEKVMDSMKAKLNMSREELEAFLNDPDWDTTTARGLRKLLSEVLHTSIFNAIIKITENGYTEEDAMHVILRSGPFHGSTGDLESNIVDRCLDSLKGKKKYDDSEYYSFQDLKKMVDFTTLEMVTVIREIKPTLSVREAVWYLLWCDLNLFRASDMKMDLRVTGTSAEPETDAGSQSGFKNQETLPSNGKRPHSKTNSQTSTSGKEADEICDCRNWCSVATHDRDCRNWCSVATHDRDAVLRRKVALLLQQPYAGRMKKLKKKFSILKNLSLVNKQSPPFSSEQNKNTSLPLKETEEKQKVKQKSEPEKTMDYYLKNISRDEKGVYTPQDDNDILKLEAVIQLQALQKELQSWNDWATSKVMEVTKRLSKHREEVKMLKAEKEEAKKAMKDKEAVEDKTTKRLLETTRTLNTTNSELNVATSAIIKLQAEESVLKKEMETERNRSIFEAKRLEHALIQEEEALKKSQYFGSEKIALEDLKVLKRQVVQKQRELEKAKCLLTKTEIRVAKEERETSKIVNEAESIENERERVEALAKAEIEIMKENAEEEFKKYETEKKTIEYEISAFTLEAESKQIVAMQKSRNMNMDSSKRLEVFKYMSQKKKKKDRECVMCLNEEMTVVFVPCGHKVLCKACNVKHEEKMNECPSCRTPIHNRINSRSAKA